MPPEFLRVIASVTLETSGDPRIVSSLLDVHVVAAQADAASLERAAHEAERSCPVSRALQGNVVIRVHATLDQPSALQTAD